MFIPGFQGTWRGCFRNEGGKRNNGHLGAETLTMCGIMAQEQLTSPVGSPYFSSFFCWEGGGGGEGVGGGIEPNRKKPYMLDNYLDGHWGLAKCL